MAAPKIVYPSGGGTTILFPWQPLRFSPQRKRAERTDSISTAGVQQSMLERIENLLRLEIGFVPTVAAGSEAILTAWGSFFDEALKGTPWDYFKDANDGSPFGIFILTDTDWNPTWSHNLPTQKAIYKFTILARKKIP